MPANKAPQEAPLSSPQRSFTPYERLRHAITTGGFEPGRVLLALELAEWLGVSRTPVREALTRLEQDGLVSRTDRGLIVRERSPEEILDIYETRIVLETMVARVAASRRTAFDLVRLRSGLTALESVDRANKAAVTEVKRAFHRLVWQASHNVSAAETLERLNLQLAVRYPETTLLVPGRLDEANQEHRDLVQAIERQDIERAGQLAAEHFTTSRDLRLQAWADEQEALASQQPASR